jgi:hypothetical protein
MRKLFYFGLVMFLFVPITQVSAQYVTPTTCQPITCSQPPYSGCQGDVGPGSFPVCNHGADGCDAEWSCTETTGCTDNNSWSNWSGCVDGVEGETRYCINSACCGNAAEARLCDPNPTGPGGPGGGTDPPTDPTDTPATPQVGDIQARAVQVDPADTSCTAIRAIPTSDGEVDGAIHQFTPSSASQPAAQAQSGANYVTFSNIDAGTYTIDPSPPSADWAYVRACSTNLDNGTNAEGLSRNLPNAAILRWDIGYTLGTAWVQAQGGDVYSSGTIRSYLPSVTPRVFITDGTGGYSGVMTYGTSFDFDSDPYETGADIVSTDNWQVNTSRASVNYYDYFYRRFGAPTTPTTEAPFDNLTAVTQPASNCTASTCSPYYVVGDMTTSGAWSVGTDERIVIIVNGNLTINGRINITGNGFIAFIVNGTITVSDTVGTTASSTTPVVEGIYIATTEGQSGSINTGESLAAASARFVGRGMFISNGFLLQRDLQGFGTGNTGNAAELFIYNPQLLLTMPESMKELSVTWQEVSP